VNAKCIARSDDSQTIRSWIRPFHAVFTVTEAPLIAMPSATSQDTQPTTASIAIASALVAGVTGYFIGQAKSLGLFGGSPIAEAPQSKSRVAEDQGEDSAESSDEEDEAVVSDFPDHKEECKMVLVVRTDLGMTKGTHAPTKSGLYCR
jgi:hypothetical protein